MLKERLELVWNPETILIEHPNGMKFTAFDGKGAKQGSTVFYSTGGGAIKEEGVPTQNPDIYALDSLEAIIEYCNKKNISLSDYVYKMRGINFRTF